MNGSCTLFVKGNKEGKFPYPSILYSLIKSVPESTCTSTYIKNIWQYMHMYVFLLSHMVDARAKPNLPPTRLGPDLIPGMSTFTFILALHNYNTFAVVALVLAEKSEKLGVC